MLEFKINYLIDDIDKYMFIFNNIEKTKIVYELIGIIIDNNNTMKDKNILTYCKSYIDKKWYCYNDSKVENISEIEEIIKGIPCVLLYQKINYNSSN